VSGNLVSSALQVERLCPSFLFHEAFHQRMCFRCGVYIQSTMFNQGFRVSSSIQPACVGFEKFGTLPKSIAFSSAWCRLKAPLLSTFRELIGFLYCEITVVLDF